MVLPRHIRDRRSAGSWAAELRGDEAAVTRRLADYAAAGVDDVIVCDYGVNPVNRLAALEWFAPIMARFQVAAGTEESV